VNIRLLQPVDRDLKENAADAKKRLFDDSMELDNTEEEIATLRTKLSQYKERIPPDQKRLEALVKLCNTLEAHLKKLEVAKKSLNIEEQAKLHASECVIGRQHAKARELLAAQEKLLNDLKNEKNKLEMQFQHDNISFSQAIQQQTKRRIALELSGEAVTFEDELTEQQKYNKEYVSQWFYRDKDRDTAEALFLTCKLRNPAALVKGTFLVRASSGGGNALSIWMNNEVKNVRLVYEDKKFGFAYPYVTYASISDVIVHYTETPLTIHNTDLDTKLTQPIGRILASINHTS
jgi:hypothetical protein